MPAATRTDRPSYHHGALRQALVRAGLELARESGVEAIVLREAIEHARYDWKQAGATLPDAMLAIFQQTGAAVHDEETGLTFQRLDLKAALDHIDRAMNPPE